MRIDPLDKLFSQFIRMRAIHRTGGCERCGHPKFDIQKDNGDVLPAYKQLQCAHLISRWHKSTRWEEGAALGLCGGCHNWIDHEAEEKEALLVKFLGEQGAMLLKARARTPARYIDRAAITLYLKSKIREEKTPRLTPKT